MTVAPHPPPGGRARRHGPHPGLSTRRYDARELASIGLIALGVMLGLAEAGLAVGAWTWPVVLGALGVAVITRSLDEPVAPSADEATGGAVGPTDSVLADRGTWVRLGVGALFVIAGVASALATADALPALRQGIVALVAVVGGLALIMGPWLIRVGRELADERRARIRADERDQVATHLHDSVLQTLALIQRSAASGDDAEVGRLARRQERDLRAWLFEGDEPTAVAAGATLTGAARVALDAVEDDHRVRVDLVTVGDAPRDPVGDAVVGALVEAVRNAAEHAGVEVVDAYLEVTDDLVLAAARDRGRGFDPAAIDTTVHHGIARSIHGRLERVGGTASITSSPGAGTEVEIEVPR